MVELRSFGRRRPRHPVEVRVRDLEREPAVLSWRGLGAGNGAPERLELLRNGLKSSVYRLPGVGRDGTDVVAKKCLWEVASNERGTYEALLDLAQPGLHYYGFVAEPKREYGWLFVEEAHGQPFDGANPGHRRLAARWLARLHTRSSRLAATVALPDRGPAYYLAHLRNARARIPERPDWRELTPADRETLEGLLRLLDSLEASWAEVCSSCDAAPRALVHGDFAKRNVRVRGTGAQAELLVFDWEVAGWGPPAVDLMRVERAEYLEAVREQWPELDLPSLRNQAALGELLRGGIAAASWGAESERPVRTMAIYLERMKAALEALGWS